MASSGNGDENWTISTAAELFAAMGNQRRLEVLNHLVDGEATVNDMAEIIGLSQSALSQHLAVLRGAKLVKTRRNGQTIYYSIKSDAVLKILAVLGNMDPTQHSSLDGQPRAAKGRTLGL